MTRDEEKARREGLTREVIMHGQGASVRALISPEIDIRADAGNPDSAFMRYNLDDETFEPVSAWLLDRIENVG